MDILYYSNYCKHSQKILQFLVKGNLTDKINFVCVDNRYIDKLTHQTHIKMDNGKVVALPPNITCVPALLLVNQKYKTILGDDIIKNYEPDIQKNIMKATGFQGEPQAYHLGGGSTNVVSEQYTFYNMSPDELSAKGKGNQRQMFNYISASHDNMFINTPPDTYRPDKVSNGVTIEKLMQQRNEEIGQMQQKGPYSAI